MPDSTVTVEVTDQEGNPIATIEDVPTDEDGSFSITWTVPEDTEPGILPITVTDDEDPEVTATEHLTVTDEDGVVQPGIIVHPDEVAPGEDITVEGQGFTPGSTVTVDITDADGNVIDTIEGVEVGDDGTFTVEWTVPEGTEPGELTVTATDDEDPDVTASDTVTVT
ncbi:hypothetical protein SD455_16660, partial [Nesterenkonia sp. K-15-9-6]